MKLSIFDLDNWREIGATLARNKTRTFLTAFGIFWGTAMLALLWGGARGFQGIMTREFAAISTNLGAIFPHSRNISYKGYNKGSSWEMNAGDVAAIRHSVPHIENMVGMIQTYGSAAFGSKTASGQIIGSDAEFFKMQLPDLIAGRLLNESDDLRSEKVCLVGQNRANDLFGTDNAIGKSIEIDNVFYRVVGVVRQTGEATLMGRIDDSFYIPSSTFRAAYNFGDKIGAIMFTVDSGHTPTEMLPQMFRILASRHYLSPEDKEAVSIFDVSEFFDMVSNVFLGIKLLAIFIGLSTLMAGVIGVGNIMWIIVKERTHEFGIRRSIGAKPIDITIQVLSEAIILTLVAGTAGVCFAAIILGIADKVSADPYHGIAGFELPFMQAVGIVIAFFILGSLAGTLPAVKAMKVKPIEAMRDK